MGQYGNQPDFGTSGRNINPVGDALDVSTGENLNSAALYIGTGGTLVVSLVGGDTIGAPYNVFHNVPSGSFFPIIVSNVWATADGDPGTTCSNIVALY
jgi:hypothetical protein